MAPACWRRRPAGWAGRPPAPRGRPAGSLAVVPVGAGGHGRPRRGTRRWSTRNGGPGAGARRVGRAGESALYSALGVVTTTVRGAASPEHDRSSAGSRPGSRCSMTSIRTAASRPCQPGVGVGERGLEERQPGRLPLRQPVQVRSLRAAGCSALADTSVAETCSMAAVARAGPRVSTPAPQPRSTTRRGAASRTSREDRVAALFGERHRLLRRGPPPGLPAASDRVVQLPRLASSASASRASADRVSPRRCDR